MNFNNSRIFLYLIIGFQGVGFILASFAIFVGDMPIFLPFFLLSANLLVAAYFLLRRDLKMQKILEEAASAYCTMTPGKFEGNLPDTLRQVLDEAARERYLYSKLIPTATKAEGDRGDATKRVFKLVSELFPVDAISLRLFEDSSGVSARNFSVGCPKYADMDVNELPDPEFYLERELRFSGRRFGTLKIELNKPVSVLPSVIKSLDMIAVYASILFSTADFQTELGRLRELSEESQAARTGFLANLSHEIRGPLGVILNSSELVLDGLCGEIPESARETLFMVKESSNHLMDLVNDVLDYAKIESGIIDTKPMRLVLYELMDDMAAVVRSQAINKQQKLIVERPDERIAVVCDRRHARQMLINLLTNAIKYTPDGGTITVYAEKEGFNQVKIMVKDTGVGISENDFSKVFGAFERVDGEYSRLQQGTGLGMPLTKRLVEANKGSIGFTSEAGVGSLFWIALPAEMVKPIKTEEHDGSIVRFGKGENILLVEPDQEQRDLFKLSLDQRGFLVTPVASAAEVLRAFRANKFSAVIIETDLPDLGGEDLIQSIRSLPAGAKVPMVVMSGKAFVFDVEHFLRLGVDRCLSKPFSLVELSSTVRRIIDETDALKENEDQVW
ncbi:MAG TPA: ATP-binding protein [Oligoflexia bacterium]|nr:ATP-binding protein [Oligoflexia bacterium]HMP47744.1 ATP-binding protein [Oligoflexia bacterium]